MPRMRDDRFLAIFCQVAEGHAGVVVAGDRAHRHLDDNRWGRAAVAVAAFAVPAVLRDVVLLELKVEQGGKTRRGLQQDVPTVAAIATVRAASGDILLPSEAAHAISAVPGLYEDFDLIDKHGLTALTIGRPDRQYKCRSVN